MNADPQTPIKLGIVGAGAMGSMLGFYLSAHAEVWLLDPWLAHVKALNAQGVRCERDGITATSAIRATSDASMVGPCDAVLVLVKAQQTSWAARQAQQLLKPTPADESPSNATPTIVVTLQNGLGNHEVLAETLGEDCVGQGVTALGATLLGPGRVRHAGMGVTTFGSAPQRQAMQRLVDLFNACGLPADLRDDLDSLVWGKLVVNVGINALTALLQVPNGAVANVAEVREIATQAVAEAVAVAQTSGIALPYADPFAHVLDVARATGANRSSMLQDVLRSTGTEIATINGAVVRAGQRCNVATPVNAMLAALVAALDATANQRLAAMS